jgi:hypothetical protein
VLDYKHLAFQLVVSTKTSVKRLRKRLMMLEWVEVMVPSRVLFVNRVATFQPLEAIGWNGK